MFVPIVPRHLLDYCWLVCKQWLTAITLTVLFFCDKKISTITLANIW